MVKSIVAIDGPPVRFRVGAERSREWPVSFLVLRNQSVVVKNRVGYIAGLMRRRDLGTQLLQRDDMFELAVKVLFSFSQEMGEISSFYVLTHYPSLN